MPIKNNMSIVLIDKIDIDNKDVRNQIVGKKCGAYKRDILIQNIVKPILLDKLQCLINSFNKDKSLIADQFDTKEFLDDILFINEPNVNKKYNNTNNLNIEIKKELKVKLKNKYTDKYLKSIVNDTNLLLEFRDYSYLNTKNKTNISYFIKKWVSNKFIKFENKVYSLVFYNSQSSYSGKIKKIENYKILCNPFIKNTKDNIYKISWNLLFL